MARVVAIERANRVSLVDAVITAVVPVVGAALVADKLMSERETRVVVEDAFGNTGTGYGKTDREAISDAKQDLETSRRGWLR